MRKTVWICLTSDKKVSLLSFVMVFIFCKTCILGLDLFPAIPRDKQAPKVIPASKESIGVGGIRFRIVKVAFDKTAIGFVPSKMGEDQQVLYVELQLLSGLKESFKNLDMILTDGSGQKSKAIILVSGNMIQMLSDVIWKGPSSEYRPKNDNIVWAYAVSKCADEFYLNFPKGEVIDLKPMIK
jgi:hypothetical protein